MRKQLIRKLMSVLLCLPLFAMAASVPVFAEEWEDTSWQEPAAVNPYYGGWGNCTWSAWQLANLYAGTALPDFGSASNWFSNASSMGYTVSSVPQAGSIVCWSHHVGYVSAVSEDGNSVYIIEGGYMGAYHEGWFPAYTSRSTQALLGYIYLW